MRTIKNRGPERKVTVDMPATAATGILASDASETNSGKIPSLALATLAPPLFFLAAFFGMAAAKCASASREEGKTNGFERDLVSSNAIRRRDSRLPPAGPSGARKWLPPTATQYLFLHTRGRRQRQPCRSRLSRSRSSSMSIRDKRFRALLKQVWCFSGFCFAFALCLSLSCAWIVTPSDWHSWQCAPIRAAPHYLHPSIHPSIRPTIHPASFIYIGVQDGIVCQYREQEVRILLAVSPCFFSAAHFHSRF